MKNPIWVYHNGPIYKLQYRQAYDKNVYGFRVRNIRMNEPILRDPNGTFLLLNPCIKNKKNLWSNFRRNNLDSELHTKDGSCLILIIVVRDTTERKIDWLLYTTGKYIHFRVQLIWLLYILPSKVHRQVYYGGVTIF